MHEWALAESVAASIEKELAQRPGASLQGINLLFGELQNVDPEIFQSGLVTLLETVANVEELLNIETELARFRCGACGTEWGLNGAAGLSEDEREAIHFLPEAVQAFMHCPKCGGVDYRVVAGRGISLQSIELRETEKGEAPNE